MFILPFDNSSTTLQCFRHNFNGFSQKWCNVHTPMNFFPSIVNHHLSPMHLFFHYFLEFSPCFRPHMKYWSNVWVHFLEIFLNFHFPTPFGKEFMHLVFVGQATLSALVTLCPPKENLMPNIKGNQIELTNVHLGCCFLTMNHLWLHVVRVI
jgi:hypothetical protein